MEWSNQTGWAGPGPETTELYQTELIRQAGLLRTFVSQTKLTSKERLHNVGVQ